MRNKLILLIALITLSTPQIWAQETTDKDYSPTTRIVGKILSGKHLYEEEKYDEAYNSFVEATKIEVEDKDDKIYKMYIAIAYDWLGSCYRYGHGTYQSYSESLKWLTKAANLGRADSQCAVGYYYWNGYGTDKNCYEAVKWYRKSAAQDDATAQYNLGIAYYSGDGVATDLDEAKRWFLLAKENGNTDAQEVLDDIEKIQSRWYHSGTYRFQMSPSSSYLSYMRECINGWCSCQNGAITQYGAGVAIYGGYGYASTGGTPSALTKTLKECNAASTTITDVNITENGNFVVIYGNNGYHASGAPQSFLNRLKSCNAESHTIYSACFNDNGDWFIITKTHTYTSNDSARNYLNKAEELYGEVYSVFLTWNGCVSCHEKGVYYMNIPSNVKDAISNLSFKPRFVKFTDNGLYLISDGESQHTFLL